MEAPEKIWINPSTDLPKLNGIIDKDSVQYIRADAFIEKVKEVDLTWQDIKDIAEIGNEFMNSDESDVLTEEEYYTEILKRFIEKKGGEA